MGDYIPSVTSADYKGNFILIVGFDNGVKKEIDCKKHLRGSIFEPLKDESYFKRFFVDGQTVAWPNGADIAPDTLYEG